MGAREVMRTKRRADRKRVRSFDLDRRFSFSEKCLALFSFGGLFPLFFGDGVVARERGGTARGLSGGAAGGQ